MEKQQLHNKFIDRIINHDYSYQYSDDHRAWTSGNMSYNILVADLKELITEHKVDPTTLLEECLSKRSEQFTDGLTHQVINGLFEYCKNTDNENSNNRS